MLGIQFRKNYICQRRFCMTATHFFSFSFLMIVFCIPGYNQARQLPAVKATQSIKIDGSLDDVAWASATVATDFIQNFPTFGLPASEKTEVRIVYDNSAIYVGAFMYDDPQLIRKQITARDAEQQSDVDYFSVFFDTYNDHQNGFQFLVTTANVQTDARLSPNFTNEFNNYGDKTWDAVWESRVGMKDNGWVVEMRIPYISLRFAKKDIQTWGLQLMRYSRRKNESSFWNAVDPQVNGFVNQFGQLQNLKNIQPPLRLSLSPYVTTGYRYSPQTSGYLSEWLRNGGMDIKYGINESLTLDATLVPDFGQVISDNVVNNLTPYEVKFTENRPFFTEGTEIFNKAGLFYSRRVGATPSGFNSVKNFVAAHPEWKVEKNPTLTQLYNATKFSGRTGKKLGIGFFNAVTAPMEARIRNTTSGKDSIITTEPMANYNIVVLDQSLKGRSYLTFTNTSVLRSGAARDANVSALDFAFYNKRNSHVLTGTARYSRQWQAVPAEGFNTSLKFGKVSGNWQYYFQNSLLSDKYNPNDLGILRAPNDVTYRTSLSYKIFKPTRRFITYNYSITPRLQYLYKPYVFTRFDVTFSAFWVFKNFWDVSVQSNINPTWEKSFFELRTPGRYLSYPANYGFHLSGSTDSRKKLFVSYGATYALSPEYNNELTGLNLGARYRFNNRFSMDLQTSSSYEKNQLGYAFMRETNGEPIVAFRDNREFISILSGIYNFTSRLNLTLRARHYWNKVDYFSFHNVTADGKLLPRSFIGGRDENLNLFNLDAFLTWDFRLGSRLIVGYKNWLGDEEMVMLNNNKNTYLRNLQEMFNLRHGNELTIRFIYFLDYNQLRKKR